jgi:hypothetical protein
MMRVLLVGIIAGMIALCDGAPKRVFVDPASRWMSIHDKEGTNSANEFIRDAIKSCPETIVFTDDRSSADYSVSISRSGVSAGSVIIYANGSLAYSFKPGHAATLLKVAQSVCDYVQSGHPPDRRAK